MYGMENVQTINNTESLIISSLFFEITKIKTAKGERNLPFRCFLGILSLAQNLLCVTIFWFVCYFIEICK